MAGPFKMKGWDPLGIKAKKELKLVKKNLEMSKNDKTGDPEVDQGGKDYPFKPKKDKRAPGTSNSYMKKHSIGPYAPKSNKGEIEDLPNPQQNHDTYKKYKLPKEKGKFMQTFTKLKKVQE